MLLKTLFATGFYSDRFNYAIVCEDEKKSSIYPSFVYSNTMIPCSIESSLEKERERTKGENWWS